MHQLATNDRIFQNAFPGVRSRRQIQRGRVASVQFFEAHVGQPNKSIVMLESAPNASHMVVVEGDVRNALPVGQKVEMTLRKDGSSNVLVNVNYA